MNLRRFLPISAYLSLGLLLCGSRSDADVYSPVVGFLRFQCPSDSDTRVSVPFHPAPRWVGRLDSAPADAGGGRVRLELKDTPGFAPGELTDATHFLLCRDPSGPEGRHFRIAAHGENHIDIVAGLGELGALAQDGLVSVIPGWTLANLFPPDTQTTFHPSAGRLATQRGSELLLFDRTTPGTDLAPSRRFYVTDQGWFEVGTFASADKVVLAPGEAFVVRHPPGVAATDFFASEQVYGGVVSLPIRVSASGPVDTWVALPRPVTITLDELDFGAGQFEESPGTAPEDRRDQLLLFDNAEASRNKAPAAVYFRSGGQWLRDAAGFPPAGAVEIEPSAGLLVRKAQGGADAILHWANAPTYDVTAP